MGKKNPSPVQVSNPTSENHLVRLCPNQGFTIRLDEWFEAVDVDWTSKFFVMKEESHDLDTGSRTLIFEQRLDLTMWSKVSNVYLGEVIILGRTTTCSVCVQLDSTNPCKSFVTTAVNPIGAEIKIEPHHVMEVVLFDRHLGEGDQWDVHIAAGGGLSYECLGYECLRPSAMKMSMWAMRSSDEVYFTGPRQTDELPLCSQHHFWFRCDGSTISHLHDLPSGVASGGNLVFSGRSKMGEATNVLYQVNVKLNLRHSNRDRLYQSLLLPRYDSQPIFTVIGPHLPMHSDLRSWRQNKKYRRWDNTHKTHFVRPVSLKKKSSGFNSYCY